MRSVGYSLSALLHQPFSSSSTAVDASVPEFYPVAPPVPLGLLQWTDHLPSIKNK